MAHSGSSDHLFRRYLTRTLEESERNSLSERLLSDPGLSDELAEFEAEWIDARARGELPPAEAAEVDAYLSATGALHRLAIARRLQEQQKPAPSARRLPLWLGLAAAAVAVFVLFRATQPAAEVPRPITSTSTHTSTPAFTLLLVPGTRSAEPRHVTLPPGVSRIEFQLALDAPLAPGSYRAELQSATGQPLHAAAVPLAPGKTSLPFALDAALLAPGSYVIVLTPASVPDDPVNAYAFEIR